MSESKTTKLLSAESAEEISNRKVVHTKDGRAIVLIPQPSDASEDPLVSRK